MSNISIFNPCPLSEGVWERYDSYLSNAPGSVLINRKEFRDGFGAVVSDGGTQFHFTGARVDDNGCVKISGGALKSGYSLDKHNQAMDVIRSLENQTHLSASGSVLDDEPEDPLWYEWGFIDPDSESYVTEWTWTDPGANEDNNINVFKMWGDVSYTSAYIVTEVRGGVRLSGSTVDAEGYINYRRKGETTWRRGPQMRHILDGDKDRDFGMGSHMSCPIMRLAPGTVYEFQVVIEHPAALGDSTTYSDPLSLPVYEFKTRHQPYAPKTGSTVNITTRTGLFSNLGSGATLAGGHVTIQAGDYSSDSDQASGDAVILNLKGTQENPLLVEGIGEVIIPHLRIQGAEWVILHNVKVANRAYMTGDYDQTTSGQISCIHVGDQDNIGITLSSVDLHWHSSLPQTWEEGYRNNIDFDLYRYKINGIPSSSGPLGESSKYLTFDNCDFTDGPKRDFDDAVNDVVRATEWANNEGFDIRSQSMVMRRCNVINNYDNSLTGVGSGNGLAIFNRLENNLIGYSHDDALELEKGQSGHILLDNTIFGAGMLYNLNTGVAPMNHRCTNRTQTRTISPTFVSTGQYDVEFTGGDYAEFLYSSPLWQDIGDGTYRCWSGEDVIPSFKIKNPTTYSKYEGIYTAVLQYPQHTEIQASGVTRRNKDRYVYQKPSGDGNWHYVAWTDVGGVWRYQAGTCTVEPRIWNSTTVNGTDIEDVSFTSVQYLTGKRVVGIWLTDTSDPDPANHFDYPSPDIAYTRRYNTDINKAHPGNDDIYATDAQPLAAGDVITLKDASGSTTVKRTGFVGSSGISMQDESGTLPIWVVNHQHTGVHEIGGGDNPLKWRSFSDDLRSRAYSMPGNFVGCFFLTQRGCNNVTRPGWGGGYYFANNMFSTSETSWDNTGTSSNEKLGDVYNSDDTYKVWDYNGYYNNNQNYKRYWAGKSLSSLRSDYGWDINSIDFATEQDAGIDNVLSSMFENFYDEVSRGDRDLANDYRPNWNYADFGAGGSPGRSTHGVWRPLRAKTSADIYGAGIEESDPLATILGPTVNTLDDPSSLSIGASNKSVDRRDIAPNQALLGSSVSGTIQSSNYEQYTLPEGWTSEATSGASFDTVTAALGIDVGDPADRKLFLVNSDQTVAVLIMKG